MKIKGKNVSMIKLSYLQSLGLSADEAYALKKGKEIEVEEAGALLKAGLVSVIEVEKPKVEIKKKSIKVKFDEENEACL